MAQDLAGDEEFPERRSAGGGEAWGGGELGEPVDDAVRQVSSLLLLFYGCRIFRCRTVRHMEKKTEPN